MEKPEQLVPGTSDHELMALIAAGSSVAFSALMRRHQNAVLNYFVRMGVSMEAEDLVQETFLRVFKYRRRYRPDSKFTTFLYVLARNVRYDHGRRTMRREKLRDGLEQEAAAGGASQDAEPGAAMDVQQAMAGLSPKLREAIVLNVFRGLPYQEVAEILGVPLGTVKSRINLALHELRRGVNEQK